MELNELEVFVTVAAERSFSKAATRLHRTQPAISQAVRRLEEEVGERLFDRTAKDGKLTEAGRVLLEYAERLMRLAEEAEAAVRELRDLKRGRILIGANEAAVHALLPILVRFRERYPRVQVDVRRIPSRQIGVEVLQRSLDFGVLSFAPAEVGLSSIAIGEDELVMLMAPTHPLAGRRQVGLEEFGHETVIAHNESSPARDRVLRFFEQRHVQINIQIAMPSLDGIKRAVEMGLGVAMLPRRCALSERRSRFTSSPPEADAARLSGSRTVLARGRRVPRHGEGVQELAGRPGIVANQNPRTYGRRAATASTSAYVWSRSPVASQ
jgi:DNA-binding transcriptional LysR family regulator